MDNKQINELLNIVREKLSDSEMRVYEESQNLERLHRESCIRAQTAYAEFYEAAQENLRLEREKFKLEIQIAQQKLESKNQAT